VKISRFAPSPTGRLHLGHAYSAVMAQDAARHSGGRFLLRIEDLDPTRSRPEFLGGIFEDLEWLGLAWGEPVLVQSKRNSVYEEALDRLRLQGLVYACFCTRSDIAAALEAPHGPAGAHYPGTCRPLPDDPQRRASTPHCSRLDSAKALELAGCPSWTEEGGVRFESSPADFEDVILARKDAPAAYHLACVVDDAASGVTMVVRGADLRSSTPVQRLLQNLLGLPQPHYLHHPLVAHADGRRLAKRDRAPTLAAMRESGVDGRALAAELLAGKLPLGFTFLEA
jgi:glutamyl-Q tRNA(Asp) synthetase